MSDIFSHRRPVFVYPHPDDEVYSCVLASQLAEDGKDVTAVFITSGDMGGDGREAEALASMKIIGLPPERTHFLRVPERELLARMNTTTDRLSSLFDELDPDCVIGIDFEGGHNVHDVASFITSQAVARHGTPSHWIYPTYHQEGKRRIGGYFAFRHDRGQFDASPLSKEDARLKVAVIAAHASQVAHFLNLELNAPGAYFSSLFEVELLQELRRPINYRTRPSELGYKDLWTYEDFQTALTEAGYHE